MAPPYAFVTLLTSDSYLPGALALAGALKDVHSSPAVPPEVDFQTVCLVTPESVDVSTVKLLRRAYNVVIGVELIAQEDDRGLKLLGRPDLNTVLTKLHIFRLTQYSKIIFLDADVLPIRPLSHLFTLPHEFSAVPDVGWPDIFNSGVLVLSPGEDKFTELSKLLKTKGSWDGGDQGILNEWRGGNWNRLSFTYNTTPTAAYTYAPAYERFGSQISAIHFIGPNKPWNSISYRAPFASNYSTSNSEQAYDYNALVDRWFTVYDKHYRSEAIVPSSSQFAWKRYVSAWNEDAGGSAEHLSSSTSPGGALGLEDLRKLAIEGMSKSGLPVDERFGEGEYKSMPLEGRVDLMRPQKGDDEEVEEIDIHATPTARNKQLPTTSPPRWYTNSTPALSTPGVGEVPPSPHLQPISLPHTPTPYRPLQHRNSYFSVSDVSGDQGQRLEESLLLHEQQESYPVGQDERVEQFRDYRAPSQYQEQSRQGEQQYQREMQYNQQQPYTERGYHQQGRAHQREHQPEQQHPHHEQRYHEPVQQQKQPHSQKQGWQEQDQREQQGAQQYRQQQRRHDPQQEQQYQQQQYQQEEQQFRQQQHRQEQQQHERTHSHDYPEEHRQPEVQKEQQQQYHQERDDHQQEHRQGEYQHQHHQEQHHEPHYTPPRKEPPRPISPPMFLWNPAIEPPPKTTPDASAFPSDTYFPNIWDQPRSKQHDHTNQGLSPLPDSSGFFQPPPNPEIPESLRRQGHYRHVTGEDSSGSTPSPDRAKVKHVFPWEEKPRHLPGRVFPISDAPKPSLFLSPGSQTSSTVHSTPESQSSAPPPRPPSIHGLPTTLTYANAWDGVPSIQKYASRLVRPPPQPTILAPAFDNDAWRKRSGQRNWDDRTEASSRDGDDEDEADDEDSEVEEMRGSDDSERGSHRGTRSRKGSSVSGSYTTKGKKKEYRSIGVQTIPRETKSQSVQVAIAPPIKKVPSLGPTSLSGKRQWAPSSGPKVLAPAEISHVSKSATAYRAPSPVPRVNLPARSPTPSPPGMHSPRESPALSPVIRPSMPARIITPPTRSTIKTTNVPQIVTRQISNDSSLGSPLSSIGPVSPPEGQPISSPMRKGGRVWDPARGVELFKRGSEEVLARFLKMGSWEDDKSPR